MTTRAGMGTGIETRAAARDLPETTAGTAAAAAVVRADARTTTDADGMGFKFTLNDSI